MATGKDRDGSSSAEFFDELARRGHEPLLKRVRGTVRFDLVDGKKTERWLVTVDRGDIAVSRRNVGADCVLRTDRAVFEGMASGKLNAFAAVLRGEMVFAGDPRLMVALQRLLPAPPSRKRR
jgi:putative sterol carrier protein